MTSLGAFLKDGDLPSFLGKRKRNNMMGRVGDSLIDVSFIYPNDNVQKSIDAAIKRVVSEYQTANHTAKEITEDFYKVANSEVIPWVTLNMIEKTKNAAIWTFKDTKSGAIVLGVGALGYLASGRDFTDQTKATYFSRDTVTDLKYSVDALELSPYDANGLYNSFQYVSGYINSHFDSGDSSLVSTSKDAILKLLADGDLMNQNVFGDLLRNHYLSQNGYSNEEGFVAWLSNMLVGLNAEGLKEVGKHSDWVSPHTDITVDAFTKKFIKRSISSNTTMSELATTSLSTANVLCLEVYILKEAESEIQRFQNNAENQKILNNAINACNNFLHDTPSLSHFTGKNEVLANLVSQLQSTAVFNSRVTRSNPYFKGAGLHERNINVDAYFKQKGIAYGVQLAQLCTQYFSIITESLNLAQNPTSVNNIAAFVMSIIEQVNSYNGYPPYYLAVIGPMIKRWHSVRNKSWRGIYKLSYVITGICVQGGAALALFLSYGVHISYLNSIIPMIPGLIGGLSAMIQCRIVMVLYSFMSQIVLGHPGICRPINVPNGDRDSFTLIMFIKCITARFPNTSDSFPSGVKKMLSDMSQSSKTSIDLESFRGETMEEKMHYLFPSLWNDSTLFQKIIGFLGTAKDTLTRTERRENDLFCFVEADPLRTKNNDQLQQKFVCSHATVQGVSDGLYILLKFDHELQKGVETAYVNPRNEKYTLIAKSFSTHVHFNIDDKWFSCEHGKAAMEISKKESIASANPQYCLYERAYMDKDINVSKTFEDQIVKLRITLNSLKEENTGLNLEIVRPRELHKIDEETCELKAVYFSAYPKKKELPHKDYRQFLFDVISNIPSDQRKKFDGNPDRSQLFPANIKSMTRLTKQKWNASEGREALLYGLANYFCNKDQKQKGERKTFTINLIDQYGTIKPINSKCEKPVNIINPPTQSDIATLGNCNCLYVGVILPHLFMRDRHYIALKNSDGKAGGALDSDSSDSEAD